MLGDVAPAESLGNETGTERLARLGDLFIDVNDIILVLRSTVGLVTVEDPLPVE